MATNTEINKVIAKWLYGNGHIITYEQSKGIVSKYWNIGSKYKILIDDLKKTNFHEDYDLLMSAYEKFLSIDGNWYATYRNHRSAWVGKGKNRKLVRTYHYTCPITTDGRGRMFYGEKLNRDFEKKTLILAMHYSLYRFIKNGKEY